MHMSGKTVCFDSVNSYLLSLGKSWGSKEEGLDLFSLVMANDSTQDDELNMFPTDVGEGDYKYQYQIGSTPYFESHGNTQSTEESSSNANNTSSYGVIHMPDHHLLEDDLKLMGQFIKDYRVPPEIWFSLLTRIRYAHAFCSPRTCKLYRRICLLAFTVLVQATDAPEELLSFFANKPDYISRSIRIVPSEEVVSGTVRTNTMLALSKIMHQPSCPLHHIVVSASAKLGASTFASIALDHMSYGGHTGSSGSEASISTKCCDFAEVIDLIDVSLLERPNSCNSVFLDFLYRHGVTQSVLACEAISQLLFKVILTPASPMDIDVGNSKQDEREDTDHSSIYAPLASYGKRLNHLVTSSFILSIDNAAVITEFVMKLKKCEHLRQAFKMNSTQFEKGIHHGTINCFIHLKELIVMGVDSRSRIVVTDANRAPGARGNQIPGARAPGARGNQIPGARAPDVGSERVRKAIVSDSELKFDEITQGVYVTICGSANRCSMVQEHLKERIYYVDMDLEAIRGEALSYMSKNPLNPHDVEAAFFLVGKKREGYTVYEVQDSSNGPLAPTIDQLFYAIGSGAAAALSSFSKENIHVGMTEKEGIECVKRALLCSATTEPGCGGEIRVYCVKRGICDLVFQKHAMEMILEMPQEGFFDRDKLFFILEKRRKEFTPEDLWRLLNGTAGNRIKLVHCIVETGDWLLYRACFASEAMARQTYNRGEAIDELGSLRKRQFRIRLPFVNVITVTTFVGFASEELLRKTFNMKQALNMKLRAHL